MEKTGSISIGSLVNYRTRDWVLADREGDLIRLRPLTGDDSQAIPVSLPLMKALRQLLPEENLTPAKFPWPNPEKEKRADFREFRLFGQGARLTLRDGVAPLRSLGRVDLRPRAYQLVPLLMALNMDPVRLLIADDVGVGKTVEAGLVVRELWDRKAAWRLAVLAPPHLLEQWEVELREKFALDPVVITAGRLGALERRLPPGKSVYEAFPVQLISIDFVKHERHRPLFLQHAPELVIVDEAHGVVGGASADAHRRYALIKALAEDSNRHLILLTATPHSGIPEAFNRLLGLLNPEFERWDLSSLTEEQRNRLARHFVQRTRRDIEESWGAQGLFPKRIPRFEEYTLSEEYRKLYDEVHAYAREIVKSGEGLSQTRQRMRWWAALSLLRSVMSSPASAKGALARRRESESEEAGEDVPAELFQVVMDTSTDEAPDDEVPALPLERPSKLSRLKRLVEKITPDKDAKLQRAIAIVKELLAEGYYPVIWCHYVKTAEYVGEEIRKALKGVNVAVVTGRMDGELRREAIEELMEQPNRVLVATDCVSEGVNLQKGFSAVLHYDLPWNPNRLEQREGRIDRYGQSKEDVVAVRYRGKNNPVDQKVVEVLLEKAERIRNELGVYVPVPEEDLYVVERMTKELFGASQQTLFGDEVELFDKREQELWSIDHARERVSRTRFAQRAFKPKEVLEVMERADAVLGSPNAVEEFVLLALAYLGFDYARGKDGHWEIRSAPVRLPAPLEPHFLDEKKRLKLRRIGFYDLVPAGVTFLGRTHPVVHALARHFFEGGLRGLYGRWGVWQGPVKRATYLYLLRPRYLMRYQNKEILGEEILVFGLSGGSAIDPEEARRLFVADPQGNVPEMAAKQLLGMALRQFEQSEDKVEAFLRERAKEVEATHRTVLKAAKQKTRGLAVKPLFPADLLGVVVLQPKR